MRNEFPVYGIHMDVIIEAFFTMDHEGREPIDVCMGMSSFDPREHADVDVRAPQLGAMQRYGHPLGRPALRQALARRAASRFGVDVPVEQIMVTEGASGALFLAMSVLLEPGREVIIPQHCFPAYRPLAHLVGARAVPVEMGPDGSFVETALERAVGPRTAAILVNTPNNPLGIATPLAKVRSLRTLGIPLIVDGVYEELVLDGEGETALALADEDFICLSLSKSHAAAGLRVGFLAIPDRYAQATRDVRMNLGVATSLPSQLIAQRLVEESDAIIGAHLDYLRAHRDAFVQACESHGLPLWNVPRAGFYGAIDLTELACGSEAFTERLLKEQSVSAASGINFADDEHGYVRVCFAAPRDAVVEAVRRIAKVYEAERG